MSVVESFFQGLCGGAPLCGRKETNITNVNYRAVMVIFLRPGASVDPVGIDGEPIREVRLVTNRDQLIATTKEALKALEERA